MFKKYELIKIELEKQAAFQHMQSTLAAYNDAKSRAKIAYETMQSAWLKRRDVRDKLSIAIQNNACDIGVIKADFEQVRQRHKATLSEYELVKAEKDRLKSEFEFARVEYKRLKDEYQRKLEHVKSKD